MPCPDCVAATKEAGVLTRCPEHPLKHGGLQFRKEVPLASQAKSRGSEFARPLVVESDWPARPMPVKARTPFLALGARGVNLNRGTYDASGRWADGKKGWQALAGSGKLPPSKALNDVILFLKQRS